MLRERLLARALDAEGADAQLDALALEVADKRRDPYSAVEEFIAASSDESKGFSSGFVFFEVLFFILMCLFLAWLLHIYTPLSYWTAIPLGLVAGYIFLRLLDVVTEYFG